MHFKMKMKNAENQAMRSQM